jgi:hypothetical protein
VGAPGSIACGEKIMRKFHPAAIMLLAGLIFSSTQARAGLILGPIYDDVGSMFSATLVFEGVDRDEMYSVSPSISPSGKWGISEIMINETATRSPDEPDIVEISGSILDLTRVLSGSFEFRFGPFTSIVPIRVRTGQVLFFAHALYLSAEEDIVEYWLDLRATVIPVPSSIALLITGIAALVGPMIWARRPAL